MDKVKKGWDRVYTREEIMAANSALSQEQAGVQTNPERGQKRNGTKDRINDLYANYKVDPKTYESRFWQAVTEFAVMKLRNREFEFADMGTSNTSEDYAQEIVMKVMSALTPGSNGEFKGDATNFYAWLHRICYTQSIEFMRELIIQKNGGKVIKNKGAAYPEKKQTVKDWERTQGRTESMFTKFEDGEGEWEGGENPEIHETEEGSPYSMPTDVYRWTILENTDWLNPMDRAILKRLILGGSYKSAATELGLSVKTVRNRMASLTKRLDKPSIKGSPSS